MHYLHKIVMAAAIAVLVAVSMSSQPSVANKVDTGSSGGELPVRLTPLW